MMIDGKRAACAAAVFAALLQAGCGSDDNGSEFQMGGVDAGPPPIDGSGVRSDAPVFGMTDAPSFGMNDTGSGSGGDACAPNLTARLRDFVNKPGFTPASALDNDFENALGDDRGIVATDLGADKKPVYANTNGTTATTHGKAQFDEWYRDTAGINIPVDFPLVLTPGANGTQTYDNQEFFPLDGQGWNDEYTADDGMMHNFSFTFELHTTFGYAGGETFTFIGDDDVFVFINNKLVVDLGGVHAAETKSINLDTLTTDDAAATPVPLAKGTTYPLDIFYNERHTVASHFRMDTSIAFNNCNPIIIH
jgi:fibro-slime domain-containing protein